MFVRCQGECSCNGTQLHKYMCAFRRHQSGTSHENALSKARKKEHNLFRKVSKIVLKFQAQDRRAQQTQAHTWAHTLTGITDDLSRLWEREKKKSSLLGSLGNHLPTYSRARGRNHGRLSGKVSKNVCSERTAGPCRRNRVQPGSPTLWHIKPEQTLGGFHSKSPNLSYLSALRQSH